MLCARTGQLIPSFGYGKLSRAKEGDQVAIDCSDSGRVDL
jgi:hypothetical protein